MSFFFFPLTNLHFHIISPQTTLLPMSLFSSSLSLPLPLWRSLFKSSLILSSYIWTAVITFVTQILLLTAKYIVCACVWGYWCALITRPSATKLFMTLFISSRWPVFCKQIHLRAHMHCLLCLKRVPLPSNFAALCCRMTPNSDSEFNYWKTSTTERLSGCQSRRFFWSVYSWNSTSRLNFWHAGLSGASFKI